MCDQALVNDLKDLTSQINPEYVTNPDGSGFDYTTKCHNAFIGDVGGKEIDGSGNVAGMPQGLSLWTFKCCGDYPDRFSYRTDHNECCDNSFLTPVGAC